jgi:hypothetical protein
VSRNFTAANDRAVCYSDPVVVIRYNRREIERAETVLWSWKLLQLKHTRDLNHQPRASESVYRDRIVVLQNIIFRASCRVCQSVSVLVCASFHTIMKAIIINYINILSHLASCFGLKFRHQITMYVFLNIIPIVFFICVFRSDRTKHVMKNTNDLNYSMQKNATNQAHVTTHDANASYCKEHETKTEQSRN